MSLKNHINKLEYFLMVAEEGSLKKASERAFVGQPQLTKVIQQLEDILGSQLVTRSVKGITLTKEGQLLKDYAKQMLQEIGEIELRIKSGDLKLKGNIRIGTYDSIARYFFPSFLKYLKTNLPDVNIFLNTGPSLNMTQQLEAKKLDIIVVVPTHKKFKSIEFEKIYTDSFGLYKSPHMRSEFTDNLIYFPFPMNETETSLKKFGFKETICCDNLETVKSLTEEALGVGLLPHRVARESILSKKIIPYKHSKIKNNSFDEHEIVLGTLKNKHETKDYVIEELKRFLTLWYNR